MKKRLNKKVFLIVLLIVVVLIVGVVFVFGVSNSELLESGTRVEPDSDLIYYLDVTYDGVDKYGVTSADDVKAEIKSNYIYVEDVIPEGLIFNGFVKTEDGSIGAYSRNTNEMCLGKVVDDTDGTETLENYHGLRYDSATRKVTFKISGLQAGCVLTVGIKTKTPLMGDEHRKDFYNTASSKEGDFNTTSNTVHAWMGVEEVPTYKVNYQFDGEIPEGVLPPESVLYVEGASVSVNSEPKVYGYLFSGWTSDDVTITDGLFLMPDKEVTLKGSFVKLPKYKLEYKIDGFKPSDYELPLTREYYADEEVLLDSLSAGDIVNGYEFSGWKDKDGNIVKNIINIGTEDMVLTGVFKIKTYKITYQFYDTVLPPNSANYLPATADVVPGATVTLPVVNDIEGYDFVRWYKEDNFIMPEKDIVIYGEWKIKVEYFEPRIEIAINPEHDILHKKGSEVEFEVKVFNDQTYPIKDVYVGNNLKGVDLIVEDTVGSVASDSVVLINEIGANSFASYKSVYTVGEEDFGTIDNEVEILSVLAEGNKALNNKKVYKAVDDLEVMTSISVCTSIINSTNNDKTKFTYVIKGTEYNESIELGNNECEILYVEPGEYTIIQKERKGYKIAEITEGIKENGEKFILEEKERINIKYVNELIVRNPNTSNTSKMFVKFLMLIAGGALAFIIYKDKIKKRLIN